MSRGSVDKALRQTEGGGKFPDRNISCPVPLRTGALVGVVRGAWTYGGLPSLVISAILIASGKDAGLASFMFWLAALWIILVRYVEVSGILEGRQPSRGVLRRWHRFSAVIATAAAGLYALARVAAPTG